MENNEQNFIAVPSFKIDAETNEVRLPYDQFHTWMTETIEKIKSIQGILGPLSDETLPEGVITFSEALSHMMDGGYCECNDLTYRVNCRRLEVYRELELAQPDEVVWRWTPATEQPIYWAMLQNWYATPIHKDF